MVIFQRQGMFKLKRSSFRPVQSYISNVEMAIHLNSHQQDLECIPTLGWLTDAVFVRPLSQFQRAILPTFISKQASGISP